MRTKMKKVIIALAVIMMLAVTAYAEGNKEKEKAKATDIFADEKDGIIIVRNATGIDIVLFVGKVEYGILLGGIRANSTRNFDISKIDNIPEEGAFIIRGVPFENYRQKGASIAEGDVLYTGLVIFNMINPVRYIYLIPGEIDETMSFCIYVSNNSRTVCELRLNSPDGQAITALPPLVRNKEIWIKPSDFGQPSMLWPIFISVDHNGTIQEPVPPAGTRGSRAVPTLRGESMMMLQFDNPEEGDKTINLLFESHTR